ncbi:hypothetical protein GCM10018793_64430 [Streptomyces sulfonofaciens]|uniref:Uncharacterized protein n=1 Tax=Streptomyces sulfonofaciens TaxID=68272 RepID=A0A919GN45_9ACTN|nr:hypothetical protein GCM10018793_64430 [Streptomyces sulfonofaciens]
MKGSSTTSGARVPGPQVTAEPVPPYPKQRQPHPGLESLMEPRPRYRAERYRPASSWARSR